MYFIYVSSLLTSIFLFLPAAFAAPSAPVTARWTAADDQDATLAHILEKLAADHGIRLNQGDFKIGDDRPMAFEHYQRYDQILQDLTIKGMAIRIWTEPKSGKLVQVEARVEPAGQEPLGVLSPLATSAAGNPSRDRAAREVAGAAIKAHGDDLQIVHIETSRYWQSGRMVLEVKQKAKRGYHAVAVDALTLEVISDQYTPYENADLSVPAFVYPIYEEYKGQHLPRMQTRLKHILRAAPRPTEDPYAPLRTRTYPDKLEDDILGVSAAGQQAGYWSMDKLKADATVLREALPKDPNEFAGGGDVILEGRYATVSIYPDAFTKFPGVTIPKVLSPELFFGQADDPSTGDSLVVPTVAYRGLPLTSRLDAVSRPATRDPDHNPAVYINEGYDEVQVYWSVNELFEALRPLGFKDPELSERPFHAFLFDPDIGSRDNAFYTEDTINFATYSKNHVNDARDNTTIWHELGHGVMDRLMGPELHLADTGGLSEGMADFVAEMVVRATDGDQTFPGSTDRRIINNTGFFLTNEVHDDGEAYGGTMKVILDQAVARWGRQGLHKVVDVVLESMRLCRDHPGLTAEDWFDHLLFADSLGRRGLRQKGELHDLIEAALKSRNFGPDGHHATYSLTYQGKEVAPGAAGSRGHEIKVSLAADARQAFDVNVKLTDGDARPFQYPLEVRVFFKNGPLQGAVHWEGEEAEPQVHVIESAGQDVTIPLAVRGTCEAVNRDDGSCSDFAYIQIWEKGATKPVAKKRFYVRVKTL